MNFIDFVNTEAPNIWRDKHLAESHAKMQRFGAFNEVGFKDIADVTARDIHAFSLHLLDQDLSENTVNHYKAAISAILKHALDLEEIDKLPKSSLRKCGLTVYAMSHDEIEKLDTFLRDYKGGSYCGCATCAPSL